MRDAAGNANENTWWTYSLVEQGDLPAHRLTVGVDGGSDTTVLNTVHGSATGTSSSLTYSAKGMPWYDPITGAGGLAGVRSIVFAPYKNATAGVERDVRVLDLVAWFAEMGTAAAKGDSTGVTSFNGAGLDTSGVTSASHDGSAGLHGFSGLFAGDAALQNVDIRTFDMQDAAQPSVTGMFYGVRDLRTITVGKLVVLKGTTNAGSTTTDGSSLDDAMPRHMPKHGTWVHDYWFGWSSNVADGYPTDGPTSDALAEYSTSGYGLDYVTYTWDAGNLGGRFPSNPHVWWRYAGNPDANSYLTPGLLYMGSDTSNLADSYIYVNGADLPWRQLVDASDPDAPLHDINNIKMVKTGDAVYANPFMVGTLNGWFGDYTDGQGAKQSHTGITAFDGSGIRIYHNNTDTPVNATATNTVRTPVEFTSLFDGCSGLASVVGVSGWDTRAVSDFSRAFYGTVGLFDLDLANWEMTQVAAAANVKDMFRGMGSSGTVSVGVGGGFSDHVTHGKLNSITLNEKAVLEGTGLGYDTYEAGGANFHPTHEGRWVMGESIDRDLMTADPDLPWFDSTDELAKRYLHTLTGINNLPSGLARGGVQYLWKDGEGSYGGTTTATNLTYAHTYTWDRETLGGRFVSNHMAWWTYGVKDFTLTLGADDGGPTKVVTETSGSLPWESAMAAYATSTASLYTACWAQTCNQYEYHDWDNAEPVFYGWATNLTLANILNVRHVKTKGDLAPERPDTWFDHYYSVFKGVPVYYDRYFDCHSGWHYHYHDHHVSGPVYADIPYGLLDFDGTGLDMSAC